MNPQDALKKVLILCTGNSCRSQMAEAIVNHDLAGQWMAFSAGTHPTGVVSPLAVEALNELGIHHRGVSKSVELFRGGDFQVVITVCDNAAEDIPVWLGRGRRVHIGFPDPAGAEGNAEERLVIFRQVRDQIREQVVSSLQNLEIVVEAVPVES